MQSDFLTWRRIQNNTLYQIFITLFCLLPTVLSYSIQLLFLSLFSSFYKILQFLLLVLIRNISSIYSNLFILFSIFKDYKVSGGGLPWWLCKQDHKINNSKTGTINISSFFTKDLRPKLPWEMDALWLAEIRRVVIGSDTVTSRLLFSLKTHFCEHLGIPFSYRFVVLVYSTDLSREKEIKETCIAMLEDLWMGLCDVININAKNCYKDICLRVSFVYIKYLWSKLKMFTVISSEKSIPCH